MLFRAVNIVVRLLMSWMRLSPCESAVAVDEGEEVVSLALVDEEVFS